MSTSTAHPLARVGPLSDELRSSASLRYVRHGATAPNLQRLRCGGDLDVPLHEQGVAQAEQLARRLADVQPPFGLIITSPLRRTRQTAAIIARALPGVQVLLVPGFAERRLGAWNLRPIDETQPWLAAGQTPPGGESDAEFVLRVGRAVQTVKAWLPLHPLLVGSKGVARVLGQIVGLPRRLDLGNAELAEFRLADLACLETAWGTL